MEEVKRLFLSDDDREVIENLQLVGLDRRVSTTIVALNQMGPSKSKDIEDATGLRQPDVSMAMKEMRRKGWAAYDEVKGGKGRRSFVHRMIVPLSTIVKEQEQVIAGQYSYVDSALARLKGMA